MSTKMTQKYYLNRRKFIRGTSLVSGLVISGGIHGLIFSCSQQSSTPETTRKSTKSSNPTTKFIPDVEINLKALPINVGLMQQNWLKATQAIYKPFLAAIWVLLFELVKVNVFGLTSKIIYQRGKLASCIGMA
jgi:hypothetical protein